MRSKWRSFGGSLSLVFGVASVRSRTALVQESRVRKHIVKQFGGHVERRTKAGEEADVERIQSTIFEPFF